jgi:ArsR family transcriptional regulator
VLKDAGIVRDRKDGRWVYYELDREALEEVETIVSGMKPRVLKQSASCCA